MTFYLNPEQYRTEDLSINGEVIRETLKEHGVCVLSEYIEPNRSDELRFETVDWLISISEGLTRDPKTWKSERLPYGPKYGMYQTLVGHAPSFWKAKRDVYPVFSALWGTEELFCSVDGASVHPPYVRKTPDWPHLDQTTEKKDCYQGQLVLTETTAAFRCTPGSHLRHREIIDLYGITKGTQWLRIKGEHESEITSWFGKDWQVPVYCKKGSLILWDSKTIHSAQRHQRREDDWRATLYICMRPAHHYTKRNITTLRRAATEGRCTNHWGSRLTGKKDTRKVKVSSIEELADNSSSLTENQDELSKKLTAQIPW